MKGNGLLKKIERYDMINNNMEILSGMGGVFCVEKHFIKRKNAGCVEHAFVLWGRKAGGYNGSVPYYVGG